jgi:hypothetical protein
VSCGGEPVSFGGVPESCGGIPPSWGGAVESPCGAPASIGAAASMPASSVSWMLERSLEHWREPSACVIQTYPSWQSEVSSHVSPDAAGVAAWPHASPAAIATRTRTGERYAPRFTL